MKPFVDWIKANHARGFVGEYGIPRTDAGWYPALDRYLAYLEANCINGTYWAAGGCPSGGTNIQETFLPGKTGFTSGGWSMLSPGALRTKVFSEPVAWQALSLRGTVLHSGYGTHAACPSCGLGLILLRTDKGHP